MKVSVAMISYNHEKFIAQAIEGVLMQKTDFDFELIIGEDCSPDRTGTIVAEYQRRFPDKIRATIREKNIGGLRNFIDVIESCSGEYVALCEGDDYWTDPGKLQKQVDYLDAHQDCAICCTRAGVFYDGAEGDAYHTYWPDVETKEITTFADLVANGDYIPTCTTVYRNHLFPELPEWFRAAPVGDWPLHLLNAQHGNVYYMSEVTAAYRRHPGGMTHSWSEVKHFQNLLGILSSMSPSLDGYHRGIVREEVKRIYYRLSLLYERQGDLSAARAYAWRRVRSRHCENGVESPVRHMLRLYLPGLHRFARNCKQAMVRKARSEDLADK